MLFQTDILRSIAEIIGAILNFLQPFLVPIGEWMVSWISAGLSFFPTESLTIYFLIFIVLVVTGIIVNTKWPGDKPPDE